MSGSSLIPKLSLGILATGIAVSGLSSVVPGGDPATTAAIIGGLGGILQSLWTNLFTGDLADHRKSLPQSAQDLYRNGHLETLYKNSIAACIESAKDDALFADTGIIADTLAALDAAFEKDHGTEFIRALPDLETADVTDIIHDFLSTKSHIPNATPAAWREFLDKLIGPTDSNTISTLRDRIAQRIHTDFARALYERAKESAAKSPETFAGILLHFQSDTLSAITDTARTIDRQLLPAVRSVVEGQTHILELLERNRIVADKIPDLTALADTFNAQVQQLKTHDLANADRYDKIAAQLRDIKGGIDTIQTTLHRIEGKLPEPQPPASPESYSDTQLIGWRDAFLPQALQEYESAKPKPVPVALPKPASKLIGRQKQLDELLALCTTERHISITAPGGIGKTALAIELIAQLPEKPARSYVHDFYRSESLASFIGNILGQAGIASRESRHLPALCKIALSQRKILLYIEGAEKINDLKGFLGFIGRDTRLILTTRPPIRRSHLTNYNIGPLKIKDAAKAIHHYAKEKSLSSHGHNHPQTVTDRGWLLLARDMGGHALGCRLAGEYCGQLNTHPATFHQTLKELGLKPLIAGDDSTENLHILFRQTALALIEACPEQADSPEGAQCNSPGSATQERSPGFAHTDDLEHFNNFYSRRLANRVKERNEAPPHDLDRSPGTNPVSLR